MLVCRLTWLISLFFIIDEMHRTCHFSINTSSLFSAAMMCPTNIGILMNLILPVSHQKRKKYIGECVIVCAEKLTLFSLCSSFVSTPLCIELPCQVPYTMRPQDAGTHPGSSTFLSWHWRSLPSGQWEYFRRPFPHGVENNNILYITQGTGNDLTVSH